MMCDQLIDEAAEALIPGVMFYWQFLYEDKIWEKITVNVEEFRVMGQTTMVTQDKIWEKITVNVEEFRVMGDPAFRMHFRLSKDVFENLLQDIGNHLIEEHRLKRERRPLSHILLMVLWILATPECFRAVALRFEACPSEVHDAYVYMIEALRELAPQFITWPNQEERVVIKANMRRISDFPGIVGIIDGCNVPISAPVEDKAAYRDYHHQYSIKMQAVCDDKLLVRDLYVGEAGSLHDARVFRRSPLCSNLLEDPNILSEGEHIIGDSAYMLLNQLLTPFENRGDLRPLQRQYNRRLCKVRARIEHTFGHAKCLWRRLHFLPVVNMSYALDHIVACIVLHNYKILHGDQVAIIPAAANIYDVEDARVLENDVRAPEPRRNLDANDPHIPQDFRRLVEASHLLGQQKRWDISNSFPLL